MPFIEATMSVLVPTALVAGFVRGFSGFGGPMIMLPVLSAFVAPATAIWMVIWIDVLVNIQLVPEARRHASSGVIVPLLVGSLLTMPLGVLALVSLDPAIMRKVISLSIIAAALVLLAGWSFRSAASRGSAMVAGAVSGLAMGATYVAVITALYLQSVRQGALESRANFIVWGFLVTFAMVGLMLVVRPPEAGDWKPIAVLAPIYVVGSWIGTRTHHRVDPARVRKIILLLIVAVAVTGLVR